jgi:alkylation response protein AidB-like acyl-CoA dehydrogenase
MIISAGASAHAQWPLEDGAVAAGRDFLRLGYAAELAGVLDEALRRTLEYVTLRRQFGSAIGSFQAIQHRAASLLVEITACRRLVYEASRAFGSGQQTTGSLMAKARVSQAAPNVLHECVQFHGAMGFADESDIGLIFRRGIALAAAGGTAGECRTLLGQSENRSASRATW